MEIDLSFRNFILSRVAKAKGYGEVSMPVNGAGNGGNGQMGGGRTYQSNFPGSIVTPLAIDEFHGPRGDFYFKCNLYEFD